MVVTEPHRSFSPAHARCDAFDRSITEADNARIRVKHSDRRVRVLARAWPAVRVPPPRPRDRVAAHEHVTGAASRRDYRRWQRHRSGCRAGVAATVGPRARRATRRDALGRSGEARFVRSGCRDVTEEASCVSCSTPPLPTTAGWICCSTTPGERPGPVHRRTRSPNGSTWWT